MRQPNQAALLTDGCGGVHRAKPGRDDPLHEEGHEVAVGRGDLLSHDDPDAVAEFLEKAGAGLRLELQQALDAWIAQEKKTDEFYYIYNKYFENRRSFNRRVRSEFYSLAEGRISPYDSLIKAHAADLGWDWRLLAAIGYQESHWNPDAISPTGVRGIMMLTLAAAKDLDVSNRLDPAQSIHGGAEYLSRMLKRLPDHIAEPDRTWLALAAYNVGLGHLQDARILTQKRGGDADKWVDVKETLPMLSKKKWFQQTRYGYARGREPVRYVENIRSYYDILVWYTEKDEITSEPPKPLLLDSLAL